jgi:MarR family 2-MHQ and catechol resistance regulon transcriptional repressor
MEHTDPEFEKSVSEAVQQYTQVLKSADPKALAVYMALWKASQAQFLANSRAIDALDLPVTVSGSRLAVLRVLYFSPGRELPLAELAKKSGMSMALISHLVGRLFKEHLVGKSGSSNDRRVTFASLTPAGEEAFLEVLPVLAQRMTDACKDFTDAEKDDLIELLQKLY